MPLSSILFFSENMNEQSIASRLRVKISGKALSLLKFIAARSGRDIEYENE